MSDHETFPNKTGVHNMTLHPELLEQTYKHYVPR